MKNIINISDDNTVYTEVHSDKFPHEHGNSNMRLAVRFYTITIDSKILSINYTASLKLLKDEYDVLSKDKISARIRQFKALQIKNFFSMIDQRLSFDSYLKY